MALAIALISGLGCVHALTQASPAKPAAADAPIPDIPTLMMQVQAHQR
jgi:hypothetical protein